MSKTWQHFSALGSLGKDPEIRSTASGRKVAQFSIYTSRHWRDASGKTIESRQSHRCVAWNPEKGPQLADIMEKYAKRGDLIFVDGRVEYRSYKKRGTTEDVWVTEINVQDLVLTNKPGADTDTPYADAPPSDDLPL
jgi:single-strand DNA-binding protein